MAENLKKKPRKSILKNSSSFDHQEQQQQHPRKNKQTNWDEMNIIATLHPADKDYGHMKIDEPKTPYNYDEPDCSRELDAAAVAEKLKDDRPAKVLEESDDDEEEDEDADLTQEEKALKHDFEMKRKAHYNEFYAVKLARKLLEEEDEDDGGTNAGTSGK